MRLSAAAIADSVGGVLRGRPDVVVSGAEVDSRLVREGDLFVALPGARVDGHHFVSNALKRAAAALVQIDVELPDPPEGRALIGVPETLEAYHRLAADERRRRDWRVVAVTGSVGKTTTKDFLGDLLETTAVTGRTSGNRNSTLGLPAQLLSQRDEVEVFIAEAGMSSPGELNTLGEILRPDVVLYTRIAAVHTEFFDSVEEIAEAKAELLTHLDPGGTLVINADDPFQESFPGRTRAEIVRYGAPGAGARLENVEDLGLHGVRGRLVLPSGETDFHLTVPGLHQAENFLAAAAAAWVLGTPVATLGERAAVLEPAPHRGVVLRLGRDITVIDDCYNASPSAMERALALLASAPGRRVAVLGPMYELGEAAAAAHSRVGRLAAYDCDLLLAVGGPLGEALADGALSGGLPRFRILRADDASHAADLLPEVLEEGDAVLVKASRGVGLERVIDRLREEVR